MTNKALFLALGCTAALGACSLTPNGVDNATNIREAHPITVDQQAVVLRVPIDASRSGLSREALARIDAFVSSYRTRGHGPITVTAPVGGASDRAAQTAAADVRRALNAAGLPYEAMQGASVQAGGGREVIVSFQSYVATGPACGSAASEHKRRMRNLSMKDFGCASQANLAAMIADPRDLHAGAEADGVGDTALATAIETRRDTQSQVVTYEIDGN